MSKSRQLQKIKRRKHLDNRKYRHQVDDILKDVIGVKTDDCTLLEIEEQIELAKDETLLEREFDYESA